MNIKQVLEQLNDPSDGLRFNDIEVNPERIKAIMINEVVPLDPKDDFYGCQDAAYLSTTLPLFQSAGVNVNSAEDILEMGIYLTNAVKRPKSEYTVEKCMIEASLPFLEKELSLFPNVQVIMQMGDVAKKAINMIAKKNTKKNIVPSVSTYKLRNREIYYKEIRIMPSYIMTGKNILIEKSKYQMVCEDITLMLQLISK